MCSVSAPNGLILYFNLSASTLRWCQKEEEKDKNIKLTKYKTEYKTQINVRE